MIMNLSLKIKLMIIMKNVDFVEYAKNIRNIDIEKSWKMKKKKSLLMKKMPRIIIMKMLMIK